MSISVKELWSNPNYRIASIITAVMVLWFATGLFASDTPPVKEPRDAQTSESEKSATTVRAKRIVAQPYQTRVLLKGKTEANRVVNLRAEVGGVAKSLPVDKGTLVQAGTVICQLDVEDRELRVAEAKAAVDQAQIEYDGAQRLKSGGYQSETAIASAKARLEAAKADLLRRQLDLEKTAIKAPFAGVVDERPVELGTLVRVGDTCATILDLDPLLLTAQVSEQEIVHISKGRELMGRLINGEKVSGKIRYVSRNSDDITRTFRIEAEVSNPEQILPSGITAEMQVFTGEVMAHLIPASLLVLDDNGELGIRVLDEQNFVRSYNVELVGDDANGVWITGLPDTTILITVGQEYVSIGEQVEVAWESNAPAETGSAL